jgi:hypothetical protein
MSDIRPAMDRLNEVVENAEAAFLFTGGPVWAEIESDGLAFSYDRAGKQWGLFIRRPPAGPTRWREHSVENKCAMVAAFPALRLAMIEAHQKREKLVDTATLAATRFVKDHSAAMDSHGTGSRA